MKSKTSVKINSSENVAECEHKDYIDKEIRYFHTKATTSLVSFVDMSETVARIHDKALRNELTSRDINYFREHIGLNERVLQYYKFIDIAREAERFERDFKLGSHSMTFAYHLMSYPLK
jgi:hypothetical protein